jgi:hypothetical protein
MKAIPEVIVNDIAGALGIPGDLIPDANHNGKDYLSYRYRWNDNRCLVLVRVDENSVEVCLDHKFYTISDDETYAALKPLIVKNARKEFDEVRREIACLDNNNRMSVVLHDCRVFDGCTMNVITLYDQCTAVYRADTGRVDLGRVPAEFAGEFIKLVDKYFLPYIAQYSSRKSRKSGGK